MHPIADTSGAKSIISAALAIEIGPFASQADAVAFRTLNEDLDYASFFVGSKGQRHAGRSGGHDSSTRWPDPDGSGGCRSRGLRRFDPDGVASTNCPKWPFRRCSGGRVSVGVPSRKQSPRPGAWVRDRSSWAAAQNCPTLFICMNRRASTMYRLRSCLPCLTNAQASLWK